MNIISVQDKKYPKLLKKIGKDAPKQLYYKGSWDKEIFENCLAVVGSRQMTTYGKQVVERIVGEVAAAGITIVSGFMYGVDATAHKTALKFGGRTIAVMPCGIDLIHPEYQQDLYVEILNNKGLVISEYEGGMQPSNWTYPRRNRIVAGLSRAALIIEAGERSGSLITANFAKKFGRKLFVVPGPITSENSKGIMQLIKGGAEAVSSAKDVLDFYGEQSARRSSNVLRLAEHKPKAGIERKIIEKLENEPLGADDLARTFVIPASKLGTALSLMQLKGLIKLEGNKYYVN
ncbi:MAG: DNA-processing protein DprA [Candidatus Nealsonbacteria bacterium]|nr:DNA-processing protein DprA [Candidatus Nealsonbacteria bacterium]